MVFVLFALWMQDLEIRLQKLKKNLESTIEITAASLKSSFFRYAKRKAKWSNPIGKKEPSNELTQDLETKESQGVRLFGQGISPEKVIEKKM